jgi:hypothetical protein
MAPTLTYSQLRKLEPCPDRLYGVTRKLGGPRRWGNKPVTAAEARKAGVGFEDLLWVVVKLALADKDVERRLRLWMPDCGAHVLPIFEKFRPFDTRPRNAICMARAFARGATDVFALDAARGAAWGAAWDAAGVAARDAAGVAAWDAAGVAARAAAGAAARVAAWAVAGAAARDAAGVAARDAAGVAARAAAWDAARDAARDADWDAARAAAGNAEELWQFDRLIEWLSDPEPDEWQLSKTEYKKVS